jgi:thioester reductase-like protein
LATLAAKKLDSLPNPSKVICLPADLSRHDLGLDTTVINRLKTTLTTVIHSAWAVNFNLGVRSFEQQHIKGTYNLINLCLSTSTRLPAQFYFCSSISAAAGTPLPAVIAEAHIPEFAHAQNMGYARSKLVTERIVKAAAEQTGMVATVLRVGQIIGDSKEGIWNTTEAIPLMIQSAATMGALPALDEVRSPQTQSFPSPIVRLDFDNGT